VLKWAVFYALCGVLCVRIGQAVALYQEVQMHQDVAQQRLDQVQERKRKVVAELRALESKKGYDKVFPENGFIRQGERVFLFPPDAPKKTQSSTLHP
jgi:cell division protein FtsB